ncbi:MAG TPA: gamma-butyrobetaine hydroxylase-like domain-containing protein, partial [Candidatus Saccharimonadia bacterium]|nr:gamma-butyrobetaine hydroxylase-like domain-containing protein [Candidatus Saccharimonadia bacterium]
FPGVTVTNWRMMGSYAVQFNFSDGHATGIYPYDMLRKLGEAGNA